MPGKRALIVDDSRSARVILSRMLEGYGLTVDTAETAEQALEFLGHSRPDVIFMDHLMPGMDGFQAVQAIKNNPTTAMIPVIMYTSQEGELYVSQARALGAVGVLPKTVKQVEVSRLLYQLNLLPDRREHRSVLFGTTGQSVAESPARASSAELHGASNGDIEAALRPVLTQVLKDQHSELRRFMLASFEAFARRITAEMRAAPSPPAVDDLAGVGLTSTQPVSGLRWPWVFAVAAAALLPALLLGTLYMRVQESSRELAGANARLAEALDQQQTRMLTLEEQLREQELRAGASPDSGPPGIQTEVSQVPYGETPLAGARLDRLRALLDRLQEDGFRGTVRVESFVGDFCLTGSGIEGFSLAAADLPVQRCDLVGNPFEDSLSAAQRQSLDFANLIATVRQQTAGDVQVRVDYAGRRPAVAYPSQTQALTAGEWNRIAAQNNRVEFVTEPVS